MSQKEKIYDKARELGIVDGRVNGSELDTLKYIAKKLGMEHYDGVSNTDTDELERRLKEYEKKVQNNGSGATGNIQNPSAPSLVKGKNKFGAGSVANNLRDKLNTIPTNIDNAKKEAIKKGTEALKKSANPYAKAAGLAMGAYQKRKEKKEQEEKDKEEKNKEENANNENENESEVVEEKKGSKILKKIMPILIMILPIFLVVIIVVATLMPLISAYSTFMSLFHHNKDDAISYSVTGGGELSKAEQDYNNAIIGSSDGSVKGIISEYQEKYNVTIDWYLLNALITYRYTSTGGDIYSGDGNSDISDEDIEERLKDLDNIEGTEQEVTTESNSIDFAEASKKIKAFASLMVVKENGSYVTDTTKEGKVYNNVLNSKTFSDYYKSLLNKNTDEEKRLLLDAIFDYADNARDLMKLENPSGSGGVISDTSIIHVQTCAVPYSYKDVNGFKVYNNTPWNEGTEYPDYLNAVDYITGVLMGEVGGHIQAKYIEGLKAQAIAALSFLINDTNSGFNMKNGEMYFPAGNCRQLTCSPTNGCTYLYGRTSGSFGTAFVGLKRFGASTGQHPPLNEEQKSVVDQVISDVFGKIMVNKGVTAATFSGSKDTIHASYLDSTKTGGFITGKTFAQQEAMKDAEGGMNYVDILKKYYSSVEYDIIDITEGLYYQSSGESLDGGSETNNNYHYHQGDSPWGSQKLCGSGAISSNGCNITSAAIAISILKNQKITPEVLNNRQNEIRTCGPSSRPQMIMDFARLYGLKVEEIKKRDTSHVQYMLRNLATGNYVAIARLAPNSGRYATGNGHYIAIVSVKTEGNSAKVLVWDPGSRSSNRDNYWADLNSDLLPYLQSDYSFILVGR